jgi:hypothetical protein
MTRLLCAGCRCPGGSTHREGAHPDGEPVLVPVVQRGEQVHSQRPAELRVRGAPAGRQLRLVHVPELRVQFAGGVAQALEGALVQIGVGEADGRTPRTPREAEPVWRTRGGHMIGEYEATCRFWRVIWTKVHGMVPEHC